MPGHVEVRCAGTPSGLHDVSDWRRARGRAIVRCRRAAGASTLYYTFTNALRSRFKDRMILWKAARVRPHSKAACVTLPSDRRSAFSM